MFFPLRYSAIMHRECIEYPIVELESAVGYGDWCGGCGG